MWICRFGRESIAEAACVKPRTISTWFRQEIRKLPYGRKLPNEYQRAMGIVLSSFYPQLKAEIASALKVPQRTLVQWKLENTRRSGAGDLLSRTREGVTLLEMLIDPKMGIEEALQYIHDRKSWPDPEWLYRNTWRELDDNMYTTIKFESIRKDLMASGQPLSKELKFSQYLDPILFVGPHINRYANIEVGFDVYRDPDFLKSRVVGRFKEGQLLDYLEYSEVSSTLTQMRELKIPTYYTKSFEVYIQQENESLNKLIEFNSSMRNW
jgi:hypothetical protein